MGALIRAARRYDGDGAQKRDGGDDGGATIGQWDSKGGGSVATGHEWPQPPTGDCQW